MRLAIGDVVRDRNTLTLGTVAGVASHAGLVLIALHVSDGGIRYAEPGSLDVLARSPKPMTPARTVATLVVVALAALAAFLGCRSAQELGADWPLTAVTSLGSYSAVMLVFQVGQRLTGPPRFRV